MKPTDHSPRAIRAAAALAAAALLSFPAAAGAQSRAEQLLSDRPPPRDGCTIAREPRQLPTLSQLADSAALATAASEFAARHPLREGAIFGLYSIAFNAGGAVERVKDLDYMMPQGRADEFESLLRQHLRAQRPGRSFSVRVRIEPAGNPVFRVGRSEVCEPMANTRFTVEAPSLAGGRRPTPIRVRALVGEDGTVGDVQIVRGSGSDELDRWVQDSLRRSRFQPGLVDGVRVPMEYEETVQFRSRG
ncbi:MAG TPA: energy transducer TonB [Longimicrobium sp.]|nr:energy transducer TonB [Longimicrobium sp.]